MARVELEGVSKRWGAAVAVEPMSLNIADGEFLVLLGPSGCGKTTTMRMVAGLEDPSQGEIRIGGRRVNEAEPKDRDVAMVFQSYGLYPNMTVAENIAFPLKIRGMPADQVAQAVKQAAQKVELTDFMQRRPKELSGGQRQRVALARAIVRRPAVFLMDEPLSNLDPPHQVDWLEQVRCLTSQNTTVISVLHEIGMALHADDMVVMQSGRVVHQGACAEPSTHRVVEAVFDNRMAIHSLQGQWVALSRIYFGQVLRAGVV
jgi:multiple sugar transport system ATP-binding protein